MAAAWNTSLDHNNALDQGEPLSEPAFRKGDCLSICINNTYRGLIILTESKPEERMGRNMFFFVDFGLDSKPTIKDFCEARIVLTRRIEFWDCALQKHAPLQLPSIYVLFKKEVDIIRARFEHIGTIQLKPIDQETLRQIETFEPYFFIPYFESQHIMGVADGINPHERSFEKIFASQLSHVKLDVKSILLREQFMD